MNDGKGEEDKREEEWRCDGLSIVSGLLFGVSGAACIAWGVFAVPPLIAFITSALSLMLSLFFVRALCQPIGADHPED